MPLRWPLAVSIVLGLLLPGCGLAQLPKSSEAAQAQLAAQPRPRKRGRATAEVKRPERFPHRIWAACDFEGGRTRDYGWFGTGVGEGIPTYPGNTRSLKSDPGRHYVGINPVPGPRMGAVNRMYIRYLLKGATEAQFQHFSLSSSDNNHIRVSELDEGQWSEVTLDFTRDGKRNDGTPGVPFAKGERMDDLKVFFAKKDEVGDREMTIDDVIFFSEEPGMPQEKEPFPNRVIFIASFETGANSKDKYWPGEFELAAKNLPGGAYWAAARAVPQKGGPGKWIRVTIKPPRPVGARTKLRFRYHLTGASEMTVQLFDLTDNDNRHIRLKRLNEGEWTFSILDFTNDGRRNDGTDTPFAAGHVVDDIFFFVRPAGEAEVDLYVDEICLFDAARP